MKSFAHTIPLDEKRIREIVRDEIAFSRIKDKENRHWFVRWWL